MAEDVEPSLIRQAQEALSKYVKKPPLHEKFLKKPPFRFLQDLIKSIIKETKFMDGKFSDEDFDSAKDRESKIKFLDKVITEIEVAGGKKVSARPAKIVAGLDVNKTLELLILLGQAIDKSHSKKRKQSLDKVQEEKKPTKPAEIIEDKKEDEKKAAKTKLETERETNRKTSSLTVKERKSAIKTSQQLENKDTRKSTASRKPPGKTKEDEKKLSPSKKKTGEKVSTRTKDELPHDSKQTESGHSAQTEDVKPKNKTEQVEIAELSNKVESETKNHADNNTPSTENLNKEGITGQTIKKQEETKNLTDSNKEAKKAVENTREAKKTTDNIKDHKKPVDSTKEVKKPASAQNKPVETTAKESLGKGSEKNRISQALEKTSELGRVTSATRQRQELNKKKEIAPTKDARPIKLDTNKQVFTPDKSAKQRDEEKPVNIFTESQDGTDADDMFIPETQYVTPTNNHLTESKGEFTEQGQLVSQIIDTKKQLESKENATKTKIQWEESASWRKNTGEKEVGGVKTLIQQLTKNAGPLGQLIVGLQEDLDEMMQELTHWKQINSQLMVDVKTEKEMTNELVKPLMKQLEELQQIEYPQELDRVKAARMTVYNNDKKIDELLGSRTK